MKYYILEKDDSFKEFRNKELFVLDLKRRIRASGQLKEVKSDKYLKSLYDCLNVNKCYEIKVTSLRAFENIINANVLDENEFKKMRLKNERN